ncbi:MAG: SulP family inorganic anion transporter [Rhodoferax sp.]|uniref:SLC26A/SulP transporter family protein n=1 Tax=Rhodoferax sp. TaxID=50421 RepID=UPI00271BE36D|nr:SulP family inorganic anion transporter [Rhodoferax sp.]MDO9145822.1 SulP family inorganic anion transporter [Rhodoferax sp.]MDP1531571.1 SulP family inorganic anion transporter [Rhodoferax sp.]MDP1942893.1 SulP family inorganic anion transporter [Rhodoferax sp.]
MGERQKVGALTPIVRSLSGAVVALETVAIVLTLGLLAFAPLGASAPLGIAAAFVAVMTGGLVYALLGSAASPSAGPTSATALILAGLVAQLVQDVRFDLQSPEGLAMLMALAASSVVLMGLFQILMGWAGLGRLARFVPQPVLAGFMNGVALLILFSQIPILLGLPPLTRLTDPTVLSQAQPLALFVGLATAGTVWLVNWKWSRASASLIGLAFGCILFAILLAAVPGLHLGDVVGPLPLGQVRLDGLQPLADSGAWELLRDHGKSVFLTGAILAVIGSLESLLVALASDQRGYSQHDPGRELLSMGAANMVSGLCGGVPLVLSNARCVLLFKNGAVGRGPALASVIVYFLIYVLAGPLLAMLPKVVLAGMMVTIAVALSDRWTRQLLGQWWSGERSPDLRHSLVVVALVGVVTVLFGFVAAVGMGCLLAMLMFISAMNRSLIRGRFSALERPSRRIYGPAQARLLQLERQRVVLIELEGALFFGSAERLGIAASALAPDCRCLVLDLSQVSMIDASGAMLLQQLSAQLEHRGVSLLLAGVSADNDRGKRLRNFGCFRASLPGGGRADWWPDADRAIEAAEQMLLSAAGIDASQTVVPLADASLMRSLSADQFARVRQHMQAHSLRAGEILFHQGDPGDRLYVLTQGSISIIGGKGPVRPRFVSFSPGIMIGEISMLDGAGRSADAIADTDAVVWSLTRDSFDALALADPLLGERLTRNIAIHLADRLRGPR